MEENFNSEQDELRGEGEMDEIDHSHSNDEDTNSLQSDAIVPPPGPPPPPPAMYLRQRVSTNNSTDDNGERNSNNTSHADALSHALQNQQSHLRHVAVVAEREPVLLTSESELKSKLKKQTADKLSMHKNTISALSQKLENVRVFTSVNELAAIVKEITAMQAKIHAIDSYILASQTNWPEGKVSMLLSVMQEITQARTALQRAKDMMKVVGAMHKDIQAMQNLVGDLHRAQQQLPQLCTEGQTQGIDLRPCVSEVVSQAETVTAQLLQKLFSIAFDKHAKVLQARTKFDLQFLVKNTVDLLVLLVSLGNTVKPAIRPLNLIQEAKEKLNHLNEAYADVLGFTSVHPSLASSSPSSPSSSTSSPSPTTDFIPLPSSLSSSSSSLSRSGSSIRTSSPTPQLNVDNRLHSLLFSYTNAPQQYMQQMLQLLQGNNDRNNNTNTNNNNNNNYNNNSNSDNNSNNDNSSNNSDKVDVDGVDARNRTALEIAVIKGLLDVVQVLIDHGANVQRIDAKGNSYLHIALLTPSLPAATKLQCLKLLVAHNGDINVTNRAKETPLHIACRQCEVDIITFLIENGSYLFLLDAYNKLPLQHLAVKCHSASNLSSTSSSSASPSSSGFALNFSPYFNSPVHSDITIVVGEQRFFAHKLILCAHSDVFKKMLEGDWKEANNNNSNGNSKSNSNNGSSKNNESSSKVLTLSDINPNTFKHLLQFLYYGLDHVKIPKEDVTLGLDLLSLADRFLLSTFCTKLESLLHSRMSLENLFAIYTHARLHHSKSLQTAAAHMILNDYQSIEFGDEGRQVLSLILEDLRTSTTSSSCS